MADLQQEARDALNRATAGVEAIVNELRAGDGRRDADADERLAGLIVDCATNAVSSVVLSVLAVADRVELVADRVEGS